MCLYIDGKRHTKFTIEQRDGIYRSSDFKKPVEFVADRPLIVKKRVMRIDAERFVSPYQMTDIKFGVPTTSRMIAKETVFMECVGRVDYGLHAYLYSANSLDWRKRVSLSGSNVVTIYGVIPPGARYYIGKDKEVVTNKIIYFRTLELLREHYGIKKLGKPVRGDYQA